MSKSIEMELADAVLATITSGTYSQAITADRTYQPGDDVKDYRGERKVHVIAADRQSQRANRGKAWQEDAAIDVGFIAVPADSDADKAFADSMTGIREEINDRIRDAADELTVASGIKWELIDSQTVRPVAYAKLRTEGAFVSVLQFRWRGWVQC